MNRFQGKGEVLREGNHIANVRYDLVKTYNRINAGRGNTQGLSKTVGTLTFLESDLAFDMGEMYVLRLENGGQNYHSMQRIPTSVDFPTPSTTLPSMEILMRKKIAG